MGKSCHTFRTQSVDLVLFIITGVCQIMQLKHMAHLSGKAVHIVLTRLLNMPSGLTQSWNHRENLG